MEQESARDGYYSAMKRNEVLIHAATWMNLKDVMFNAMFNVMLRLMNGASHKRPHIV